MTDVLKASAGGIRAWRSRSDEVGVETRNFPDSGHAAYLNAEQLRALVKHLQTLLREIEA